jgi:hypothetical protein
VTSVAWGIFPGGGGGNATSAKPAPAVAADAKAGIPEESMRPGPAPIVAVRRAQLYPGRWHIRQSASATPVRSQRAAAGDGAPGLTNP